MNRWMADVAFSDFGRRLVAAVFTLLLALGSTLPGVAHAQADGPSVQPTRIHHDVGPELAAAGKVEVKVRVIHATNSGKVDPQLQDVMKQLRFLKYTGFRLLNTNTAQIAVGSDTTFQVVGGRRLKVQVLEKTPEHARLRIRMLKGSERVLDTTVKIHRDRSFIIGGPNYQGGKLVLPVEVRY